MTRHDWEDGDSALGLFLNGEAIPTPGPQGEEVRDDSFLLLFNACAQEREFTLPRAQMGEEWELELSTADPDPPVGASRHPAQSQVVLPSHCCVVLRRAS
jgi:glycogen operon protein